MITTRHDKPRSMLLKIPIERGDQLRALAKARHQTLADTLGDLIARAIAEAKISNQISGFEVAAVSVQGSPEKMVSFRIGDLTLGWLTTIDARDVADALRQTADAGGKAFMTFPGSDVLQISRKGSAVKIVAVSGVSEDEVVRMLAPSIARELADQLCVAAAETEA